MPLSFPPPTSVTLVDFGDDMNLTDNDISFKVEYDINGNVQILYKHDFLEPLVFSTSSIIWQYMALVPYYSLGVNMTNMGEGGMPVDATVTTLNIDDGTVLYWSISWKPT